MTKTNEKPLAKWFVVKHGDTLTVSVSSSYKTTKKLMGEIREATKHLMRGD